MTRLGLQDQPRQDAGDKTLQRDRGHLPHSLRAAELGHAIRHLPSLAIGPAELMAAVSEQQPLIRAALMSVPPEHRDVAAAGYVHLLSGVLAQGANASQSLYVQEMIATVSQLPPQRRSMSLGEALHLNLQHLCTYTRVPALSMWMPMLAAEPDTDRRMALLHQALNQWVELPEATTLANSAGERLGQRLVSQMIETAAHRPTEALAPDLTLMFSALPDTSTSRFVRAPQVSALMALIDRIPATTPARTRLLERALQQLRIHESKTLWADWVRMMMEAPASGRAELLSAVARMDLPERPWHALQDAARNAVHAARGRHAAAAAMWT